MMQNHTARASYIMGFRESNEERKNALLFVISFLRKNFPALEIIVVEQDDEPKMKFADALKVRHTFFRNTAAFNHSRAYNEGAKITDREILIFACADIFLSRADYLSCFRDIQNFEALTPNWSELSNVSISDPQKHTFEVLNARVLYTFAGGILFMTRAAFEKSGGWDERFQGWGCEDDAMSHLIFNKLTSKSLRLPMYHIDHPKGAKKNQKKYVDNRSLMDEIASFSGQTLDRYIEFLQIENGFKKGLPANKKGKPRFVFAVTTFNRYDYLKNCFDSFFKTRNPEVDWQIIIADDGSTDQTPGYLQMLEKEHGAIIIRNEGTGIDRQVNTVFKQLEGLDFDLCFCLGQDILFQQKGWDDLYWKTVQRTGYDHLIYYDKDWQADLNLPQPIQIGGLLAHTSYEGVSDRFYTLTKRVLQEVGYYDEQSFDKDSWAHADFSFRCCRMGFNVLANPFDVKDSNDFLQVQYAYKPKADRKSLLQKGKLAAKNRQYIPFNQNHIESDLSLIELSDVRFPRADGKFYLDRGISGFLGFLIKRLYNFGIDTKLYFIPIGIKKIGRILIKIGKDFKHADDPF